MAATVAMIGITTTLQVNDGASAAYVALSEVSNITTPNIEQPVVEATNLSSPNRAREYVTGLTSPGSFTFEENYTTSNYTRLIALLGLTKGWKITFPDAAVASFNAIVMKVEVNTQADQLIKMKVECKVTGTVTVA